VWGPSFAWEGGGRVVVFGGWTPPSRHPPQLSFGPLNTFLVKKGIYYVHFISEKISPVL